MKTNIFQFLHLLVFAINFFITFKSRIVGHGLEMW